MFRSIGAKFIKKAYFNYLTPFVTDANKAYSTKVESQSATRFFSLTEEGDIACASAVDVCDGTAFNPAAAGGLEFYNFNKNYTVLLDEKPLEYCKPNDVGDIKEYCLAELGVNEKHRIMVYNPSFKKYILIYPQQCGNQQRYLEVLYTQHGMELSLLSMIKGAAPERSRAAATFLVRNGYAKNLEEAISLTEKEPDFIEYDISRFNMFPAGSVIDICMFSKTEVE